MLECGEDWTTLLSKQGAETKKGSSSTDADGIGLNTDDSPWLYE